MKKYFRSLLVISLPATLLWVGCSPNQSAANSSGSPSEATATADHETMDHSKMDHSKMDHEAMTQDPADATDAVADGVKPYPLTTCVVSGEKLGEMGKPQRLVYEGQEMKFCCKDCVKDFQADPKKFITKLAEQTAAAGAAAAQPMKMPADGADHSGHQH